jgi:hypothetical protein
MKRDMDLVRQILLQIEAAQQPRGPVKLTIPGHSEEEVSYHVKLPAQAGLITAVDNSTMQSVSWQAAGLTWPGHEFLDSIKNETVWDKTKAVVKEKGGAISFEVLKGLVTKVALGVFGLG